MTMRVRTRLSILAALVIFPAAAWALTPEVHDEAGFFKPETVKKADEIIKAIKQDKKKDLLIETFKHVPAGKEKEATSSDHQEKDRFFSDWARERAREAKVNGIYVLICKDPPYIKVAVGNQTRKEFGDEQRDHLGKILVDRFKKKEYDEGLLEAVRYVQSTLKDASDHPNDERHHAGSGGHHGGDGGTGGGFPGGGSEHEGGGTVSLGNMMCPLLLGLLCVGAVIVGVIALIRMFRGGGSGPGGYGGGYGASNPPGYGGGFGGFLSTFAASLFGSAAGMWMYDTFFGGHTAQSPPMSSPTWDQGTSNAPPPEDTDYTAGGGGDIGDSGGDAGGGGDFGDGGGGGGGSDLGSGDFYGGSDTGGGGGGDAGGGGDF
jgi:hypothetical protein